MNRLNEAQSRCVPLSRRQLQYWWRESGSLILSKLYLIFNGHCTRLLRSVGSVPAVQKELTPFLIAPL